MLQDQRTLEVAGAVQPRGQAKMAVVQGARAAEQGQKVGFGHQTLVYRPPARPRFTEPFPAGARL